MPAPPLSLVIPAFNEAAHIGRTLADARAFLEEHFPRAELIIVDDGSTDDTPRILAAAPSPIVADAGSPGGAGSLPDLLRSPLREERDHLPRSGQKSDPPTILRHSETRPSDTAANPVLRVIRLPRNSGKGAAVRAGLATASGELCAFTDADLSTPLAMLHPARTMIEGGADLVLGTRAAPESRVLRGQHFVRRHMGGVFNTLVRALTGLPYADTQCGFKMFRRESLARILPLARENGFAFDVELLLIARHLGLRCGELPVEWHNRPQSHVHLLRHPVQMTLALLPMAWRWRGARRT